MLKEITHNSIISFSWLNLHLLTLIHSKEILLLSLLTLSFISVFVLFIFLILSSAVLIDCWSDRVLFLSTCQSIFNQSDESYSCWLSVLRHLVAHNLRSTKLIRTERLDSRVTRSRLRTETNLLIYSSNWIIDKLLFKKSLFVLDQQTWQLLELLQSKFIKNTSFSSSTHLFTISSLTSISLQDSRNIFVTAKDITASSSNDNSISNISVMTNDQSFSLKQMQQRINQIVFNVVRAAVRELRRQDFSRTFDSSDSSESFESELTFVESFDRWNLFDLEFFDFNLDKSFDNDDVVTVNKNVYFRNVILFIDKVRDLIVIKNSTTVRANINTALRDSALIWYIAELFNLKKIDLRADHNDVKEWCKILLIRFRENFDVALTHLTSEKYTLYDARFKRESSSYVQFVLRHARFANIDSVYNQLIFAYQDITASLRAFVDLSNEFTTIFVFLQILKLKKNIWFEFNQTHNASS